MLNLSHIIPAYKSFNWETKLANNYRPWWQLTNGTWCRRDGLIFKETGNLVNDTNLIVEKDQATPLDFPGFRLGQIWQLGTIWYECIHHPEELISWIRAHEYEYPGMPDTPLFLIYDPIDRNLTWSGYVDQMPRELPRHSFHT